MDARDEARAAKGRKGGARERILDTSYELFARRGIRDVGVDEIITRSGVAKATFYRHFPSKDALVLAYLDRWFTARSAAVDAATKSSESHDEPLLAVFGVLDDWFQRGRAEASAFLHVMIEMGPDHPLGRASIEYLTRTREQLATIAAAAGLDDPEGFAWSCHILIKGAMVADSEGDTSAAERARLMASLLIEHHRQRQLGQEGQLGQENQRSQESQLGQEGQGDGRRQRFAPFRHAEAAAEGEHRVTRPTRFVKTKGTLSSAEAN
ncbi:TetR/AcrR family transcriptional regulator [Sinomonas terrae]|uniref:TetR/AcrR family transcriptional regulator n=1 Tax=Sinomonas terrae TaxID=2908838 RepID=A0ABS9U4I0_9MICC|nr:TetR/AcrR family transcriptional regulator [Sinomonas terrae]MCH6471476.1 TetR/AcrR family transcriptional regulator [Sinomonas terrae]